MALEQITAPSASEFSLETEDVAQEQTKGLDLSGAIDDPMDLFHGLNINAIEEDDKLINTIQSNDDPEKVVNTEGPGDPPKTLADARKIFRQGQIRDKILSGNLGNIVGASRSPYEAAKAYRFDRFKSNVERYEAYGEETFNKLGFNPLMDNEEYYNQNTSRWQEWKRMSGQFGNLFSNAFTSNYRSLASSLREGDVLELDEEGNDVFSEANRIGASTKGGFTGFATNLTLNAAYSVGITANILFEEALIWGAGAFFTPETGGASLVAAGAAQTAEAANVASKAGKVKKALNIMFGGSELGKVAKNGIQMMRSLAKAEDAKSFYQYAKGFGKGAANFVNPFRQTTETLRGIYKGEATYRNVSNVAKMSRSFGSFYRDMRENWFTIGEAQLEGAGVKQERLDENIKIFQEQHDGALPTGEDLDDAYANAYAAGRVDALGNIPLIFFTNRITLDRVFKFKGIGTLVEGFEKGMGKGLRSNFKFDGASKTIVRKAEEGIWKGALNTVKKLPKTLAGGGLWYTKANWAEGVQELGQEWLGATTKEYYKKLYTDPGVNQAKLLKTSIYDNLKEAVGSEQSWESVKANIFSKQGLSTFASGFLMGGLIGGSKYSITNLASTAYTKMGEAYMRWNNPAAFEAYKKDKLELEEKHLGVLNNLLSSPENFFNKRYQSFYNQKKNALNIDESERNKNDKDFHDSKDALTFENVNEALENGTFDLVLDSYKELSKLSDKELADYFNIQDGSKAREKLDEFQGRAKEIKKRYDYIQETFPNPFNPKNFERGSEDQKNEFIAYKGYEEAKKAAIFSQHGFDRSLERMSNIYSDLLKNPPLKKINQTDLASVINPETIKNEVRLLKQEAELLQQSDNKEDKKIGKQKMQRAEILEDYLMHYNLYTENKQKFLKLKQQGEAGSEDRDILLENYRNNLKKSYKKYLASIANERGDYLFDTGIDDSFEKIMDHYQLSDDAKMYMANVNYLTNPNNLIRHAQRISAVLNEMYDNRENLAKEGINNFFNVVELNAFIDSLTKIGIAIDPEQLIELFKSGTIPTVFFDIKSGREISKNDPRVVTIQGMLDLFIKIKKNVEKVSKPTETKQETPEQKEQPEKKEPEEPKEEKPEADKDLQIKLEEAYDTFIDESGSDMSFDDFVATHPTAARIKAAGTTAATAVQPTATPVNVDPRVAEIERRREEELNKINPVIYKKEKIKKDFENEIGEEVGLVGSVFKGTAKEDSDIDIVFRNIPNTGEKITPAQARENSKVIYDKLKSLADKGIITDLELKANGNLGVTFKYKGQEFQVAPNNKENFEKTDIRKSLDAINAKYDAELKALEGTPTQTVAPTTSQFKTVEDIKKYFFNKNPGLFGGDLNAALTMGNWEIVTNSLRKNATQEELNMLDVINGVIDISALQPAAPVSDIETKKAEIEKRAAEQTITQEQVNDLLNYGSGNGSILEQAERLIANYNRIFDVNAKVVGYENKKLKININGFQANIEADAISMAGGSTKIFSIDKEGIAQLVEAKYAAELDALEGTSPTQPAPVAPTVNIEAEKKKLEQERDRKIEEEAPIKTMDYPLTFINSSQVWKISELLENDKDQLLKALEINALKLAKLGIQPLYDGKQSSEAIKNVLALKEYYGELRNIKDPYEKNIRLKNFFDALETPGLSVGRGVEFSSKKEDYTKSQIEEASAVQEKRSKTWTTKPDMGYVAAITWAQMKLAGKTTRSLGEFLLDTQKEIRDEYQAKIAALEGKSTTSTQEVVVEEPNQRQQIAQEKIDKVLEGVAFKDLPKAFDELINLIKAGELTSDEVEAAYAQKFEELSSKLQPSDFIKGDVITFKDGRKGIVMEINKDDLNMKMFDGPGVIEKISASKITNNIASVKSTKEAIEASQKEPVVEVSKDDEDNMKKSQEGTENLATDSKRASDAINNGIDNATDQPPGFDNLFFGCD